jgi:uncharacterized membrane protein
MSQKSKVLFAFTGIFVAGAVAGGVVALRVERERIATSKPLSIVSTPDPLTTTITTISGGATANIKPAPSPQTLPAVSNESTITPALLRLLTNQLSLSPDQKLKIEPIINSASEKLANLSRQNRIESNNLLKAMDDEVRVFLDPEQHTKLDKLEADRERQITERNRPPGNFGPGEQNGRGNRRGGGPDFRPNGPTGNSVSSSSPNGSQPQRPQRRGGGPVGTNIPPAPAAPSPAVAPVP